MILKQEQRFLERPTNYRKLTIIKFFYASEIEKFVYCGSDYLHNENKSNELCQIKRESKRYV